MVLVASSADLHMHFPGTAFVEVEVGKQLPDRAFVGLALQAGTMHLDTA